MPLVEKVATEPELRAQIDRLNRLMRANPAMVRDLSARRDAAQKELNNLLLAQPGYEIVKTADVEAAKKAAYDAGFAAAKTDSFC